METLLKRIPMGNKFAYKGKIYLKCRSTIAQMIPISFQVFAVNLSTGEIISLYEGVEVTTVQ